MQQKQNQLKELGWGIYLIPDSNCTFFSSLSSYLLSTYCAPGNIRETWDKAVNETAKVSEHHHGVIPVLLGQTAWGSAVWSEGAGQAQFATGWSEWASRRGDS